MPRSQPATLIAAGLVVVAATALPLLTVPACNLIKPHRPHDPAVYERLFGPVVHEAHSDFSHLRVRAKGSTRGLFFVEPPGLEVRQSAVDLDRPGVLLIPYTRYLFTSLLVRPAHDDVLIVGLGGGGMVRFIDERLPATRVDAVEIDPAVVAAARDHFGTVADANTDIITADAFDVLASSDKRYDVIFMDAFLKPAPDTNDVGIPRRLQTLAFLKSLHKNLKPGGAVVFNIVETDETDTDLATIAAAFDSTYVFHVPGTTNITVLASTLPRLPHAALTAAAGKIDAAGTLGYPLTPFLDHLQP